MSALTGATSAWQSFSAPGSADFTIALREPIVIVPGIAGTILQDANGSEVWPNIKKMLVSPSDNYLDALTVGASTIRAAAILKTVTLVVGGVTVLSDDFYGNLIKAFANEGYVEGKDLFTVPYDWRLDIDSSVSALAGVIARARAAASSGKINIIAHSMGGLLVKKYLATVAAATGAPASFLDKLVLAGVPEIGAPYAFKILDYGDDLGIPIVSRDEVRRIAHSMPAMYELLPSARYAAVAGSYMHDFRGGGSVSLDHAAIARFLAGVAGANSDPALAARADAFHLTIDTAPVAAPNVYTIVGCGKPTIAGYDLYDNGVVDLEWESGDGTVPEVSAMDRENNSHAYYVMSGATGIDHTGLVSDARPVALITSIIAGTAGAGGAGTGPVAPGSPAPLPQGISSSAADCATQSAAASNDTTIEFGIHGVGTGTAVNAIAFGVYDASGNYTGVTASGTALTGIPGSDYEKIGNNIFVIVPAGGRYRSIERSTAPGAFAMKVRGYRGLMLDREATYLSVPLVGSSSFAELDFAGFGGDMDLHMGRKDGANGMSTPMFQNIRHPDSVLSAPFTKKN